MSNRKEKLLKILRKELDINNRNLLKVFQVVEQGDAIVFRMPASFFTLEDLWVEIKRISDREKIRVIRTDLYATVEELDNILTNIEWMWKSNIPKGFMTLVAGEPGIGKSIFVLQLAKIVTNGLPFPLSEDNCTRAPVLWIDTEMKQQLLNMRSKSMGIDRSRLYIPSIGGNLLTKFDASNEDHTSHIISIIESKKPSLMVVDSLGHSHSRGENRIEEMRPVMDLFSSIARDYNISVVVVHHLNKGREGESTEISLSRVRGSTDIVATPVVIFSLEKGAEDTIKVRQIKNNIGREQPAMTVKLEYLDADKEAVGDLSFTLYNPPPSKKTKKELCSEWVISILLENKDGMPLQDLIRLGEGLGFTRGNIYATREVLGDRITFTGDGRESIWHATIIDNDHEAIKKISKAHNGHNKEKKK